MIKVPNSGTDSYYLSDKADKGIPIITKEKHGGISLEVQSRYSSNIELISLSPEQIKELKEFLNKNY